MSKKVRKKKMPSLADYKQEDKGVFVLLKGDSGCGKSTAALSFPNAYVFDHDRKMPGIALKHYPGRTDIAWDTFEDVFQLQDKINEFLINCPYETLISDSLTHLVINVFNTAGQMRNEDPVKFIKDMKLTGGKNSEMTKMSIDYYNAETNFIERYWLNVLKRLWARPGNPRNVIVTAHVMTVESSPDLRTKEITRTRGIVTAGKKVGAYVPTEFDDMWHFGYESSFDPSRPSNSRICLFDAVGEDSAKCTIPKIPTKIDWTGKSFYNELEKWKKGDISL